MKNLKKIFTLILALAMVLAMAAPAMAAGTSYTITITNSDSISSAGHKYHAYQIFAGTLDSTGTILSNITWGENMATNADQFLADLKADADLGVGTANIFYSATTAEDVAEILAMPAHHTSTIVNAFAKHATANISGDPIASSTEGDAPYTIVIPADKAGYYLVVDDESVLAGEENKDVSDFILQVVSDVEVEHKGSIPTMEKKVSETGSTYHDSIATGIGETHHYRIIAELPDDYRLYDTYYLEFADTMSKGLSYEAMTAVKAIIRSSSTEVTIKPDCYTVTATVNADGTTDLSIVINDLKNVVDTSGNPIHLSADDAVAVFYTAKVNDQAVIDGNGIPNQAKIIYSNNPNTNGHGESNPDETNVYPINLKIVKVDGKDKTVELKDAEFILIREHTVDGVTHEEYAVVDPVTKKIVKWVHHYEGDGCPAANHPAGTEFGSVLTTDADGEFNVIGLDPGRYNLREIKAPDGYNSLLEDVEFAVNITVDEVNDKIGGMTGNTTPGAMTVDVATATVTITIDNFKGDVLPSTGGMGTTLFYLIGGLMAAAAVVLLVTRKRMSYEA